MSLPIVPTYVLYDVDGDGVVTQADVDILTASVGGPPPPGIPLCRATMGTSVSAGDVTAAEAVRDNISPPTVVLWLTRPQTDLLIAPSGSIVPGTDSFEIFIRSEVDVVEVFDLPGSKSGIVDVQLRQLDDTVVENITAFYGDQGLGFFGSTSGLDLFAQFRFQQGWWKLHIDVNHGFNITVVDYITLAQLDANQGLFDIDLAVGESKTMILQRGSTTVSLPVPANDTPRKFKFGVSPFYHGLQQLDFGQVGTPSTDWQLPPQTNVPEFDFSLTRPVNNSHSHPLALCGTIPDIYVPVVDEVAGLGDEIEVTICPSGRKSNFLCSDPKLIGTVFATLTETENADNINDFLDTIGLAAIFEDVLKRWSDFSGFEDAFNFFLYREDSPTLAFLDLSQLGRSVFRVHLNLTVLENQPSANWTSLLGPIPIWASFLHHWFQHQINPTGPVPVGLALALANRIGTFLGYSPFYFNEKSLGAALKTNSWVSAMTSPGTSAAERMEAVVLFLNNLYNQNIPVDVPGTIVDAITAISDLQVEGITDQFVELMAMYGATETPPTSTDPIILRNWLVEEVPPAYNDVIIPSSEADIDVIDELHDRGGEPVAASFLCDEVDEDDLLGLNDSYLMVSGIADLRGEKRLLRMWSLGDIPTMFASTLGSDFLGVMKSRIASTLSSDCPLVSQSQLVQAYRVTRHRLLASSFILPIDYTQKILAWPDPENGDAIRDLPSSFYDLVLPVDLAHIAEPYSSYQPDPPFPGVPSEMVVAGASALFKATMLTGTTDLILTVDREVMLTIYRYE